MTVVQGSFSATDQFRDPEEQFAEIRQKVVDSLYRTLDSTKHGSLFPTFLIEAIENEVWKHPRRLTHNTVPPMPLAEFLKRPYPVGIGTTSDVIQKLIAGNEPAMLAWDRAVRGEHGGAHNPAGKNQHTPADAQDEVKTDNISLDLQEPRKRTLDYGTSAQSGLRRLEKAASSGDGNAAELLRRVLDPADPMTVNGACVQLGWRNPTKTVVRPDRPLRAGPRPAGLR